MRASYDPEAPALSRAEAERVVAEGPILVFDGVCVICALGVRWVLRWERAAVIRFCSRQSPLGRALLAMYPEADEGDSVLFVDGGRPMIRMEAVLAVAAYLRPPLSWARVGWILPAGLRRWLYDALGSRRYRLFGRYPVCTLPAPAHRARFLDEAPV